MKKELIEVMSKEELFFVFYNAVKNATKNELSVCHVGEIVDEETAKILRGKNHLLHIYIEKDTPLTFIISYIDNEQLTIFSVDKNLIIADYHHNNILGSWAGVEPVTAGNEIISRADIIMNTIGKFKYLLKI